MILIYNTLSRKKERLKPRRGKKINLFVCGPTVYDFSHLGHARTYIFFDFLVKYLRHLGYKVFYLQNITDIDDKIIQRAKEMDENPRQVARRFEKEYLQDMKRLGIDSPSKYARATDHIKEIISQVERLLKKGYAYKTSDGIYYDVSKFKNYGKLSGRTIQQAEDALSRIDESEQKRNKGDFALWKFANTRINAEEKTDKRTFKEPFWFSPWGPGRPGWHIEDTAITEKFFGPQYDIHGGARDLIFPHHEAEIAQMEAISGKSPFVKYWLHTGFLTVRGQKMAKSLRNFVTIRDFLKKHPARILRWFALRSYYRSPIDFSEKAIKQTERELERLDEFVNKLSDLKSKKYHSGFLKNIRMLMGKVKKDFYAALEDDLNTPKALATIFDLVHNGNILLAQNKIDPRAAKETLAFLKEIDKFLQFIFWDKPKQKTIPEEILKLVAQREQYRKKKNWQKADEIRMKIKKLGYWVEDLLEGPKIKRL